MLLSAEGLGQSLVCVEQAIIWLLEHVPDDIGETLRNPKAELSHLRIHSELGLSPGRLSQCLASESIAFFELGEDCARYKGLTDVVTPIDLQHAADLLKSGLLGFEHEHFDVPE